MCDQRICQSCHNVQNEFDSFYFLTMMVGNVSTFYESLEKMVQGSLIEDYRCSACDQKVNLLKRQLIADTPNTLIIHLLRFQFSFQPKTNNETELTYPHGVLACSATLAKMSLRDHVSVLKDTNHRDDSEVLMCLHKEEQTVSTRCATR